MKTNNVTQVAAFGKLVGICNDLGASYNPSKVSIQPTALTTLLEQAQQNAEAVIVAQTGFILSVNARRESFEGIPKLAARIVRAVSASESSAENIRDVKILKRMLQSKQQKGSGAEQPSVSQEGSEEKSVRSSARLDYHGRTDTLARLIQIVQSIPSYNPNEPDLKVTSLKALLADLKAKSEAVAKAENALINARIARRNLVYSKDGIYGTGTAVKEYIRSIKGVKSEMASAASRIRLRNANR